MSLVYPCTILYVCYQNKSTSIKLLASHKESVMIIIVVMSMDVFTTKIEKEIGSFHDDHNYDSSYLY